MAVVQQTKSQSSSQGYVTYMSNLAGNSSTSISGKDEWRELTQIGLGTEVSILKEREVEATVANIAAVTTVPQQEQVSATVLSVDEVSVLCEVELQAGHIHVRLAKTLFPAATYYGMPITIAFAEGASGIRRPTISLRALDDADLRQENAELSALVDRF